MKDKSESTQPHFTASSLFRGRTSLYVFEVAKCLQVSDAHIINLIEEGSLEAFDVGGSQRKFWRIPVAALDRFLVRRSSLTLQEP